MLNNINVCLYLTSTLPYLTLVGLGPKSCQKEPSLIFRCNPECETTMDHDPISKLPRRVMLSELLFTPSMQKHGKPRSMEYMSLSRIKSALGYLGLFLAIPSMLMSLECESFQTAIQHVGEHQYYVSSISKVLPATRSSNMKTLIITSLAS